MSFTVNWLVDISRPCRSFTLWWCLFYDSISSLRNIMFAFLHVLCSC